jgi:hypothetical protein
MSLPFFPDGVYSVLAVRMRDTCLLDSTDIWNPGGLPSAMDAVISNFQPPGIVVIDTWWSPTRFDTENVTYTASAIQERLQHAAQLDIPIFAPAGASLPSEGMLLERNIFAHSKRG